MENSAEFVLAWEQFPLRTFDKIRYADTDRQGHVNNACFATFLETGRVEFLFDPKNDLLLPDASFVIASLQLQLLAELHWPGTVEIGTGIRSIGNSSLKLYQQLFQAGKLVAKADTVIVQLSAATGKGLPYSEAARQQLQAFIITQ
jgi:acyl-CoA thioester hydrolase